MYLGSVHLGTGQLYTVQLGTGELGPMHLDTGQLSSGYNRALVACYGLVGERHSKETGTWRKKAVWWKYNMREFSNKPTSCFEVM